MSTLRRAVVVASFAFLLVPARTQVPAVPSAAPAASLPAAVERPLLWRIEAPVPSYLFGTIHLPDERVTALPNVVQQAFDEAGAVFTEIPMELGELMKAVAVSKLPKGETLQQRIGDDLYARAQALLVAKGAAKNMLDSMQPWAAASQLALLDQMRQMATKQPLDMVLYSEAKKDKKAVGGLETLAEQLGVFESLTAAEQVQFFAASLERAENDFAAGKSSADWILGLYLRGDEQVLAKELHDYPMGDEKLKAKLMTALLDVRNFRMADRIVRHLQQHPERVHFFAVGAAHYPGDNGLLPLLRERGYQLTRIELGGADPAAAAAAVDAAIAAHAAAIEKLQARKQQLAPAGAGR
jgi:uncharacterized protein